MNTALFLLDKLHSLFHKLWGYDNLTNFLLIIMGTSLSWFLIDKLFAFLSLFVIAILKIKARTDYKELHISINEGENKNV